MGTSTLIKYAALPAALTVLSAGGWQMTESTPRAATTTTEAADAPAALTPESPELDAEAPSGATRGRISPRLAPHANASDEPAASSGAAAGDPPRANADPGAYRSPEVVVDGTRRVYPLTRNVWVRPGPSARDSWIGFLWFGSSVRVRDGAAQSGPGCSRRALVVPRIYRATVAQRLARYALGAAARGVHDRARPR